MIPDLHGGVTFGNHLVCVRIRFDTCGATANGGRLHFFAIYNDLGTSRRIRRTLNAIARIAGHRCQCSSEIWRIDSLNGCAPLKKIVAMDAANSDVLVAVAGSWDQRESALIEWLNSLPPLPRSRFGLLVGLLGDEDNRTRELDGTARELFRCAGKINRKFIWNSIGYHESDDTDWLAESISQLVHHKRAPEPFSVPESARATQQPCTMTGTLAVH